MKKLFALLLVIIMTLSLVACGNGNTEETPADNETSTNIETTANDKNDSANYIGVWETESFRLTITKGGVGRYEDVFDNGTGYYDLNWEVKDEVIVTQISFMGMEHKAVLELSEDMSSLVVLQNGFPAWVEGEDTFVKQQ
jgi:predicted small lipoprotein YifL